MSSDCKDALSEASARYILGESTKVTIKGNQARVSAFRNVLQASRDLYVALDEGHDLESVVKLIEKKSKMVAKYKRATGLDWVL